MNTFNRAILLSKAISIFFIFLLNIEKSNAQLSLGSEIPEISLKNNADSTKNLSSFTGKVILIDFWASWCAPCRKANQKLVSLHRDYSTKNIEIVGISLDTDRSKWLKAIAKDKIEYTQLTDPHGFDAQSAIQFGVEALPASYLFDASGKLISINPTEQEIKKQLNHIKQ